MHLPEEIQIHILTIQKYAPNDLKSIKLSCHHFNDIVNRYIVLVVTSIASWKSHDWTYNQIYATKRVIWILSSTDYGSNKTVLFAKRLLRRRLKGSIKLEVWFTEVDKPVILPRYSPLKPTHLRNPPAYYYWIRTKYDLERMFKKTCWLTTKFKNGKNPPQKFPGFSIIWNTLKNLF